MAIKKHYSSEIDLTATYFITVYATREGYDKSDIATATLCWIEKESEEVDPETGVVSIPSRALLIRQQGSVLTVQGAADGTPVSVYNASGILAGSAVTEHGIATIPATLPAGSIAIIKVGEQTVKVVVRYGFCAIQCRLHQEVQPAFLAICKDVHSIGSSWRCTTLQLVVPRVGHGGRPRSSGDKTVVVQPSHSGALEDAAEFIFVRNPTNPPE